MKNESADFPHRYTKAPWQEASQRTLELACETLAKDDLNNVILLLAQAVGQMTLGRAETLGLLQANQRTKPIPVILHELQKHGSDPLDRFLMRQLIRLHELRGLVVHRPPTALVTGPSTTEELMDSVLRSANSWGIPIRTGLLFRARQRAPIELLVDSESSWGPNCYSREEAQTIVESLRTRKMIAGYISNLKWPLVRCDLCDRCGPPELFRTTQDALMDCALYPAAAYCRYGCGRLHQQLLREEYPHDYDLADYYLADMVYLLMRGNGATPDGCSDCSDTYVVASEPPKLRVIKKSG